VVVVGSEVIREEQEGHIGAEEEPLRYRLNSRESVIVSRRLDILALLRIIWLVTDNSQNYKAL